MGCIALGDQPVSTGSSNYAKQYFDLKFALVLQSMHARVDVDAQISSSTLV